jgi:bacillopeptidase F
MVEPELLQAIQTSPPDREFAVIVTLAEKPDLSALQGLDPSDLRTQLVTTLKDHAAAQQPPVLAFLDGIGARNTRSLWLIDAIATIVNGASIQPLANLPAVESVRLDEAVTAPQTNYAGATTQAWNLVAVNAPTLWNLGFTGQGIVVAGVDTGVDGNHPALAGKWRGGANGWYDPRGEYTEPYDPGGHGTQTMGLMVGVSSDGLAVGLAPDATWIAAKAFDDAGNASASDLHLSYQWILDPDDDPATDDAPNVVNSSWSQSNQGECSTKFQQDIEILKLAGIAVAFSAGNYGPATGSDVSPANNANGFAVGAIDVNGDIGLFSSRGPSACDGTIFPEVVAPGIEVETTDLSFGGIDLYAFVTGTSFAAPHVAAGMALLKQAFPAASIGEIEAALRDSAEDIGAVGADNEFGYGLLDLAGAYDQLNLSPAPSDVDGDGYFSGEDCDDSDPTVFPGAPEIKHDGIDQDCNGYDLTIDITKATYDAQNDRLAAQATSALGKDAALELVGYGPMSWNKRKNIWSVSVEPAGGNPGAITVSGPEGAESGDVSDGGGGGKGGGGGGNKGGKNK